ncbi:MAG: UTRA domain-containing protein, partial [Candidatus Adiutrix sp.]|nr:UTRA domain-containing protein [Candidatus Adiutrix sp.]
VGLDWNQLSFSLSAATSLLRQKKHLKIKFLTIRMTKLEAGLAEAMELAPGSKVIAISRMLLVSGQPYWLQHSFLHPVPTLPVVESDLTLATVSDFFAPGHSLRLKKARAALKAELPNAADAAFLGIDQSYPVFKLEYRYFDFTDKPLGCGRLLLPPGHVAFESDLGLWN